ncbi:MAG: hypothetical protein IKY66_11240 [Bacteroidales bacterium]|nr:hypothetical protein [Bacteroidales bacterium]
MKKVIVYIIGIIILSTALVWGCIKTEIINLAPAKSAADTTKATTPPADTTEHTDTSRRPIYFDPGVADWENVEVEYEQ